MNQGFDPEVIEELRSAIARTGNAYIPDQEDEQTDEYAHVQFIGRFEGKEVIYDCVIYTLRLHHESELYELAEHQAAKHFPDYRKITYEEDENGNLETLDPLEEEIGLFMAEVIMQLEEEEQVKVSEHVDLDANAPFGVALDVGLNVEVLTPEVINKFIREFCDDTLVLDDTLYSFQTEDA